MLFHKGQAGYAPSILTLPDVSWAEQKRQETGQRHAGMPISHCSNGLLAHLFFHALPCFTCSWWSQNLQPPSRKPAPFTAQTLMLAFTHPRLQLHPEQVDSQAPPISPCLSATSVNVAAARIMVSHDRAGEMELGKQSEETVKFLTQPFMRPPLHS